MQPSKFFSNGRFQRLCLKELRESLRDRRTVMTLILMPILVYPLLGMVLQRLLLSTNLNKGSPVYVLGVVDPTTAEGIDRILAEAQHLRNGGAKSPISPIEWEADKNSKAADPPPVREESAEIEGSHESSNSQSANSESSTPANSNEEFRLVAIENGSLRQALETGAIDLAITKIVPRDTADHHHRIVGYDMEIQFRRGDARGEDAALLMRRMCQLVNDQQSLSFLKSINRHFDSAIVLRTVGVGKLADPAASIATVIPLVLILMTITGAVYPAIDLTAGERERGTMEAMIATPAPRFALLASKYVAVVTVSILTALANLFATWVTLSFGGLGRAILGEGGFSIGMLMQILPILAIFAGFFSSILLALCSFAKSFKEAQAYLIPVMLISLAPGLVTLMPQVKFTNLLAVVPLLNVLLLSRDIMTGGAALLPTVIALVTTIAYGCAALVIAANLFGAANSTVTSQATWSDLLRSPAKARKLPDVGTLLIYLAFLFPVLFVVSSMGSYFTGRMSLLMGLNAIALIFLFGICPAVWLRWRRVSLRSTFLLSNDASPSESSTKLVWRWILNFLGVLCLASTMWMFALEGVLLFKDWSLSSLVPELDSYKAAWLQIPFVWILLTQALVPAVAEEFFFRGFVLSALRTKLKNVSAILLSASLFALFHVISGNVLSLEKFIPTFVLGLVLGYVAVATSSIWPGVLLHFAHNSIVLSFTRFEKEALTRWFGEGEHIPVWMLTVGAIVLVFGIALICFSASSRVKNSATERMAE